jgi:spore coat protein CotF
MGYELSIYQNKHHYYQVPQLAEQDMNTYRNAFAPAQAQAMGQPMGQMPNNNMNMNNNMPH